MSRGNKPCPNKRFQGCTRCMACGGGGKYYDGRSGRSGVSSGEGNGKTALGCFVYLGFLILSIIALFIANLIPMLIMATVITVFNHFFLTHAKKKDCSSIDFIFDGLEIYAKSVPTGDPRSFKVKVFFLNTVVFFLASSFLAARWYIEVMKLKSTDDPMLMISCVLLSIAGAIASVRSVEKNILPKSKQWHDLISCNVAFLNGSFNFQKIAAKLSKSELEKYIVLVNSVIKSNRSILSSEDKNELTKVAAEIARILEKEFNEKIELKKPKSETMSKFNQCYSVSFFSMAAKIAFADGSVSQDEVDVINKILDVDFKLKPAARNAAVEVFQNALKSPKEFSEYAHELYNLGLEANIDKMLYKTLVAALVKIAMADGSLDCSERKYILEAAAIFELDVGDFNIAREEGSNSNEGDDYYAILGCKKSDSMDVIKQKYREKIKEFHPDVIMAKGLNESFVAFATENFRKIQEAYEKIQQERNCR